MKKLRIVVMGMMGQCPLGGQTWMHLHWLLGFHRLGHEVWYIEDSTAWPYDPVQNTVTDDCRYAAQHLATSLERVGLKDRWGYRLAERANQVYGLTGARMNELFATCDVLVNITGGVDLRAEHLAAPLRVYVETDPVTAELRLANGDEHTRIAFDNHHVLATYGENYGAPDCGVPLNGRTYVKTRQPIDLERWPMAYDPAARYFTTIGNYRQSGSDVTYGGQVYFWSKHHEWDKFLDLPHRTPQLFELAMSANAEDRARLEAHGWRLTDAFTMSCDVFGAYPEYIRRSRAEFTVAKDQNIRLRSGWFSERDVCYLASGKPVITQDTGFGCALPKGEGLFAFQTMPEVLAAIEAINADYEHQCRAARRIATDYFECTGVARRLLADIGMT
ncbi:MAG: hypothetical protein PCFJNLEI_00687 [Verrucomicrobiae bacterium]|nr:hypothetical protein [Verrucomicrobiae bacterium]